MPGNVCLNCRAFESECTYSLSTVKKVCSPSDSQDPRAQAPPVCSMYFLEYQGLTVLQRFTRTRIPKINTNSQKPKSPTFYPLWLHTNFQMIQAISSKSLPKSPHMPVRLKSSSKNRATPMCIPCIPYPVRTSSRTTLHVETEVWDTIMRLERLGVQDSFFGKDSQLALVKEAMSVRNEYYTSEEGTSGSKRSEFWEVFPVRTNSKIALAGIARHNFSLYFEKRNTFMPLLHRATFDNGLRNGLHDVD
ncbi:MAG: hypothetical protein NXY57DRAFT_197483 [Lentinula lateritia]|nr:MAG: hypothetical protein NXY57DRAFT_197483 [Lentinula lateritia]